MSSTGAPLTDLLRLFSGRFGEERCVQIASSLTFTTLLALIPIVTVALTVVSAFPVFESLLQSVQTFAMNSLVPQSVDAITAYTNQFSANAARLTTFGILFLAATALLLMLTIDRAFNNIWRVSRSRPLLQRIFLYCGVLTVGPVLIGASLSVTSYLITLSLGFVAETPGRELVILRFIPLVLTAVALALMYLIVPNRRVKVRDAFLGGIVGGVCFEAMKQAFGFFIANFPTYTLVYGTFAIVPIFLLWIYVSWLIVVGGAVLAAVLPEWRERVGQSEPVPGSDFLDALQALKMLWLARATGKPVPLSRLHSVVKVRVDHLEKIMSALSAAGWAARIGSRGWVLNRDAGAIKVEDIYRLFVFHPDAHFPGRHASAELERLVAEISGRIGRNMQISLAELFSEADREKDIDALARTA